MKKLLLVAVALSVFLGTISFAKPNPQDTEKKMTKKKKKKMDTGKE